MKYCAVETDCEHKNLKEGCMPWTICLDCGNWIYID